LDSSVRIIGEHRWVIKNRTEANSGHGRILLLNYGGIKALHAGELIIGTKTTAANCLSDCREISMSAVVGKNGRTAGIDDESLDDWVFGICVAVVVDRPSPGRLAPQNNALCVTSKGFDVIPNPFDSNSMLMPFDVSNFEYSYLLTYASLRSSNPAFSDWPAALGNPKMLSR
jgi:hypothetical protein